MAKGALTARSAACPASAAPTCACQHARPVAQVLHVSVFDVGSLSASSMLSAMLDPFADSSNWRSRKLLGRASLPVSQACSRPGVAVEGWHQLTLGDWSVDFETAEHAGGWPQAGRRLAGWSSGGGRVMRWSWQDPLSAGSSAAALAGNWQALHLLTRTPPACARTPRTPKLITYLRPLAAGCCRRGAPAPDLPPLPGPHSRGSAPDQGQGRAGCDGPRVQGPGGRRLGRQRRPLRAAQGGRASSAGC